MLLKLSEVAALLRVSKPTVRNLCGIGVLKTVRIGQRGVRVDEESVRAYILRASNGDVTLSATVPRA